MLTGKKRKIEEPESDEIAHLFSFAKHRNRVLKKVLEIFVKSDLEVVSITFSPITRAIHFAPDERTKNVLLRWLNSKKIHTGENQIANPEQLTNVLETIKRKSKSGNSQGDRQSRDAYNLRKQLIRVQQYILEVQANIRKYEPHSNSFMFTREFEMHEAFLREVTKSIEAKMNQGNKSNSNTPGEASHIVVGETDHLRPTQESVQSAQTTTYVSEEQNPNLLSESELPDQFIILPPFPIPIKLSVDQEKDNTSTNGLVASEIFNLFGCLGFSSVPSSTPAKYFNFNIIVAPPNMQLIANPVTPQEIPIFEASGSEEEISTQDSIKAMPADMILKSEVSYFSMNPDNMPNSEQVSWDIKADGYFPFVNDEMPLQFWQWTNDLEDSTRVQGEANDETLNHIEQLDCLRDAIENPFVAMLVDMDTPDENFDQARVPAGNESSTVQTGQTAEGRGGPK